MSRVVLALMALGACRPSVQPSQNDSDPVPIQTVQVPASGEAITLARPLGPGLPYLLEARGTVTLASALDAEFTGEGADLVGGVDVGIDVGRKEVLPARGREPAPASDKRPKWVGAFRPDHSYHMILTGTGEPLSLRIVKPADAPAGTGAIAVSIYRLPFFKRLLESVLVPARAKIPVQSRLTGQRAAIYILQAVGEVQVGGPGHMGDAEFHDYKADGRGYNEGENGVDFGVGVDETTIGAGGSDHDPRQRKWGPYRTDHTYYMLYDGNDHPIVFNYHDTGGKSGVYKDNAGFLVVNIWAIR